MEKKVNYKIIKLKSGEELIARIVNSSKTKLTLERPMCFRFVMIQDYIGNPKEVIVAKNWTVLSIDNTVDIPSDFVLTFMNPSPEAITLYESEKNKQDVKIKLNEDPEQLKLKMDQDKIKKEYDEMVRELEQDDEFKKMMKMMSESAKGVVDDLTDPKKNQKKDDNMIFMNMMFPPELLVDLIESEMIDPEIFGEMYQDIKKNIKKKKRSDQPKSKKEIKQNKPEGQSDKYTGDQKNHKDFGNRWTDWNPDLSSEDYR